MDRVTPPPQLRSLSIGEIFDRATTMYVRNFVVFTLITLTLLAPYGIVSYALQGDRADSMTTLLAQIQHPGRGAPAAFSTATFAAIVIVALLVLILAPFVNNAVAAGVALLYQGERPTYAKAFRPVLARAWPLLGTTLLCGLMLIFIYLGLAIVFGLGIGVLVALGGARGPIAFVALLVVVLAIASVLILVALACIFALYAVTLEGRSSFAAISQACTRLLNRHEIRKACLVTLAYIALELIVLIVTGGIGLLILSLTHSGALEQAFATITGAMLNAYVTVLLAVYYFDVRTRAEGLDLEVDLAQLPSAP